MLISTFCDYSHAYIPVKGTIIVPNTTAAAANNTGKILIFINCALFADCMRKTNNT